MTTPATAPPSLTGPATLTGPGSESGSDRESGRSRRRTVRRVVGGLVLLGLLALTAILPEPRTTLDPLAPDSTADNGSRAVAQILGRQGVQVHHATRLRDAEAQSRPGSTLFVTSHALLYEEHVERLAATGADLVLIEPDYLVSNYTEGLEFSYSWGTGTETFAAECTNADALVGGELTWSSSGYRSEDPAVELCFGNGEGSFGMAVAVEDGQRIVALATSEPFTNEALTDGGNAALALRLLGTNTELVWYNPSSADLRNLEPTSNVGFGDLLPDRVGFIAIQLVILLVFVALWRGRRLGPLVSEPLPVVVPATEVTRGRGRLYRRARSYGHAAAALRAASASRCAARLGLPRSAGAHAVLDAVSYAAGRPRDEVAQLLYGPPPTSDNGLTHLARELDRLESEVNRP